MNIVGILLAAGRGLRFDPSGARHKLLAVLPDGTPVALASARSMRAALPRVVAVVADGDSALAGLLASAGCEVLACADAGQGMATSLTCALAHCAEADGWVIALADMPHVAPATISLLAGTLAAGENIAVPLHRGVRGNPVAFSSAHRAALLALTGDQGARSLLRTCPVREVETNDPGILVDIDQPSDLAAPLARE